MDFDIKSMKLRAKELMRGTKPSPWIAGIVFGGLVLIFEIFLYLVINNEDIEFGRTLIFILLAEFIYLNIRSSCNWYCLKVAREEKTTISDVFSAFKEKQLSVLVFGIIRDISYVIGALLFWVGLIVPLYWFRFGVYIIKDEKCNPFKALTKSKKLLKGHYVELAKLDVSNLGWYALMIFTCGLASFYVKTYTTMVYAEFYDYLKAQNELFG